MSIEVANVGGADGTYAATLTVDGNVTDTKEVAVGAGATETVSFTCIVEPGTHSLELNGLTSTVTALKPAEFKIVSLSVPAETITGAAVTINADVTNVGEAEGTYTPKLTVNGAEVLTKDVVVAPGIVETVSFLLTEETPGTCTIRLGGLTGTLKVLVPSEIANYAYQSAQEVQTCEFDMTMIINMSVEEAGEVVEVRLVMDSDFALDNEAKAMKAIFIIIAEVPGQPTEQMTMEMYLLDDILYGRVEAPGEPAGWQREKVPPDVWESMQMIQSQIDMLEGAETNFLGTEEVDGIDCYILDIILAEEAFLEAMLAQPGTESLELEEILMLSGLATSMDMSMTQWVARDTYFLKRAEMVLEMDLPDFLMKMDMNLNIRSYNEPITIELPAEARE